MCQTSQGLQPGILSVASLVADPLFLRSSNRIPHSNSTHLIFSVPKDGLAEMSPRFPSHPRRSAPLNRRLEDAPPACPPLFLRYACTRIPLACGVERQSRCQITPAKELKRPPQVNPLSLSAVRMPVRDVEGLASRRSLAQSARDRAKSKVKLLPADG
jgi:hypothetical protein